MPALIGIVIVIENRFAKLLVTHDHAEVDVVAEFFRTQQRRNEDHLV